MHRHACQIQLSLLFFLMSQGKRGQRRPRPPSPEDDSSSGEDDPLKRELRFRLGVNVNAKEYKITRPAVLSVGHISHRIRTHEDFEGGNKPRKLAVLVNNPNAPAGGAGIDDYDRALVLPGQPLNSTQPVDSRIAYDSLLYYVIPHDSQQQPPNPPYPRGKQGKTGPGSGRGSGGGNGGGNGGGGGGGGGGG